MTTLGERRWPLPARTAGPIWTEQPMRFPAGDAETLADALEEAGSDMAELVELCKQGALFIQ
jgi:hypothetical protein